MSLSARIAPHLPYLRRYARAVTGTQASGDALVAATLEALIADTSIFPNIPNDRLALFTLFSRLFIKLDIELPAEQPTVAWELHASRNLASLTPASRQAFILVAVEGFSVEETATILDIDEKAVNALLREASLEISRQVATEIMIIEDEPLIAMDIESLVEGLGHRVVGIARTHREAKALFDRTQPAMILADIHLADGSSGIDAVNEILTGASIPVIFITAYPERLLTGERPEPTFLVTKPFNPDTVKALISQALFFDQQARAPA